MPFFKDITDEAFAFFDTLPPDWQEAIVPVWDQYMEHSRVYILEEAGQICAGGIVFYGMPPEMDHFREEATRWVAKGYHYIGFVWVPENQRKKKYGSAWLLSLIQRNPEQGYWLTTEESALTEFYTRNQFRYIKTLRHRHCEEQLLVYIPAAHSEISVENDTL